MTIFTEQSNKNTVDIDIKNSFEIARMINEEDKKVAVAVEKELKNIAKGIDLITDAFLNGGRLAYFGAGTSGRLGVLDASECVPTFGVDSDLVRGYIAGKDRALRNAVENAEDNASFALEDLADFKPTKNDVVVGISASGNPAYVVTAMEEARRAGVATIGISSNPEAKLKNFSDVFICPVVGQEVITGSSRMKSGTAQKMILNMLTTGAMIRTGKTYRNYMIDLQISNQKLYERACRFVSEICNVDLKEAERLLVLGDMRVKTACVMGVKKCDKQTALALLKDASGVLRRIIK